MNMHTSNRSKPAVSTTNPNAIPQREIDWLARHARSYLVDLAADVLDHHARHAEDVVQDVVVRLVEGRYEPSDADRGNAYGIALRITRQLATQKWAELTREAKEDWLRRRPRGVHVTYDHEADAGYVYLVNPAMHGRIAQSVTLLDGRVQVDLDQDGSIVGIEILDARVLMHAETRKHALQLAAGEPS
jgi:uncharacterized protein YuzE